MGHGTHWEAVLTNLNEDFAAAFDMGIQKGELIGRRHLKAWTGPLGESPADVMLLQGAKSGFGVLGVVVSANSQTYLQTAFPVASDGMLHTLQVISIHESSYGLEGCITAELGDATVNFFDPHYALSGDLYRPGARLQVSLAGIAYVLARAEPGQVVHHPEVGQIHLDGAAMLLPIKEPPPVALSSNGFGLSYIQAQQHAPGLDDYRFRGPVKDVAACSFLNRPAWRITATLLRTDNGQNEIDIPIYVTQDKLPTDFSTMPGQDLTGVLWLQGRAVSNSCEAKLSTLGVERSAPN